jgi:hypothetical protein
MYSRVQSAAKNETTDPGEMKSAANDGAFVSRMDPDLDNVIRQALDDAQAAGKAHMSQTVLAVQAVQRARPDMTAIEALAAVNRMRREWSPTSTSTAPLSRARSR